MLAAVARLLSSRRAPGLTVARALGLMAPAPSVGFTTGDHVHRVLSRAETGLRGFASRPLDPGSTQNADVGTTEVLPVNVATALFAHASQTE